MKTKRSKGHQQTEDVTSSLCGRENQCDAANEPSPVTMPARVGHRFSDISVMAERAQRADMNLRASPKTASRELTDAPPVVGEVLASHGRPLDADTREFMEPRFGHDFSRVRVHADERAAQSARDVNALAYTVGDDVVFARGRYAPESDAGRRLLAHESTHVISTARHTCERTPHPRFS